MQATRGDVVRSIDPFKLGTDRQRPWLIVNTDGHPFDGEQYITVAISTKSYADSIPLADRHWLEGGVPIDSFVSPWSVHSPRTEDLVAWQGSLTDSYVDEVVNRVESYLSA